MGFIVLDEKKTLSFVEKTTSEIIKMFDKKVEEERSYSNIYAKEYVKLDDPVDKTKSLEHDLFSDRLSDFRENVYKVLKNIEIFLKKESSDAPKSPIKTQIAEIFALRANAYANTQKPNIPDNMEDEKQWHDQSEGYKTGADEVIEYIFKNFDVKTKE